jgi:hypothetical protein
MEKFCRDEFWDEKCCDEKFWDGIRGAAKCDTGAGVRSNGAALRKLDVIRWGIALE